MHSKYYDEHLYSSLNEMMQNKLIERERVRSGRYRFISPLGCPSLIGGQITHAQASECRARRSSSEATASFLPGLYRETFVLSSAASRFRFFIRVVSERKSLSD